MGQAVMGANPFLNGKTIYDLKNWAERKMHGKGVPAAPADAPVAITKNVAQASPEFVAYKAAIAKIVLVADDASAAPSAASAPNTAPAGDTPVVTPAAGAAPGAASGTAPGTAEAPETDLPD
jgi:hypothetical protein